MVVVQKWLREVTGTLTQDEVDQIVAFLTNNQIPPSFEEKVEMLRRGSFRLQQV
ncbi:MAG TPA: hypothetical protein GX391_03635 [Firmicutes bacterium]|jgi:hypothetical protein|nr:hypothetical protein [Bacillota bacterium]HOQ24272.1 hypothetical protein [Bacillota bacterium]HPT66480.1 hypothetical protein [Bacillota bacterium]